MKNLKTLCKDYSFDHENEYFEMIINSYFCGQMKQTKELFIDMNNEGKLNFFSYINFMDLLPKDIKNINLFFINTLLK